MFNACPVDIIILNYNKPKLTADCIDSINKGRDVQRERIILIENGQATSEEFGKLDLRSDTAVLLDKNYGFAQGVNVGLSLLRPGADVVLLNNDTILPPDFFKKMRRAKDDVILGANVGILAPMTEKVCRKVICRSNKAHLIDPFKIEEPVPAVCWYIIRDALDRVGPIDSRYEIGWGEDFDYCNEMSAAGFEIWGVPSVFVRHIGSQTINEMPDNGFRQRNSAYYERKWGLKL